MKKAVILLCGLLLAYAGYTQEVRIKLENCKLDTAVLAEIQNSLNFQLGFYANIFSDKTTNSFKARVFGTEREFQKYSKNVANFNPIKRHAIAFYSVTLNEMTLHQEIDDFPGVFSHEMSHAIVDHYCKDLRTWLDEGLAEFLENVILVDSEYTFDSRQVNKIRAAESYFLEGASIEDAIGSTNFYNPATQYKNYTLAWATVMYLYCMDSSLLAKMITSNCKDPLHFIDNAYPGGLSLLASDVKSFFLNKKPNAN